MKYSLHDPSHNLSPMCMVCVCGCFQLNDSKTPNVSRRHKAEGISLLNPAACSQSFPQQSRGAPSWAQFEFDSTFPAPLGTAGQRPWTGQWPQTRTWKCPCIFFVCCLPNPREWQLAVSKGKWLLVCFKRRQWRQSSSALKGMGSLGEEWPGPSDGSLAQSSFSARTKNHPEPEKALSPSRLREVVLLLWKHTLVRTVASHPSVVLGREMHF